MTKKIQWGVLATGAIGKTFANGLANAETGELAAVGSRTQGKADAFAADYGDIRTHGSYEALIADDAIDAIYVSTPHPFHAQWAIAALEAGKHVLVEKPIGMHEYEAQAMIEAAIRNDRFLMEAYMYRCHPQTKKLVQLIKDGTIGEVRVIKATFSFGSIAGYNPDSRTWSNALGGGGILDVGGYTTSISRLVAGASKGTSFADPTNVSGAAYLHPDSGADAWSVGTLDFGEGLLAQIATGVGLGMKNNLMVFGDKGRIEVPQPYAANRSGECNGTIIVQAGGKTEEIAVSSNVTSFTLEADVVGTAIAAGKRQSAEMSWDDTLGNIRTQDKWRDAVGLVYDAEKPENMTETISGKPLAKRDYATMTYGKVEYLDKPMPRLVMGVDNQVTMRHAAAVFDEYFERGGTAFDTSWTYGKPKSVILGQWIKNRGIRDDVVFISKGAHTPYCNPTDLVNQVNEQLEWMQTDYADIYIMHRDNLDIPVGEFVDAINGLVKEGKIKAYGGSNWTLARVDEANAYAKEKDLQPMTVVSNNLSLAEMVNPVWGGCIHAHDPEDLKWFEERQIALLPWSSQARCFFLPHLASPDKTDDKSLVNSWYSDDNFKRQARAIELAEKHDVEPINIALAWVLARPFPCFPLVGPRTLAEIRSTFGVFKVELTEDECKYLNLED